MALMRYFLQGVRMRVNYGAPRRRLTSEGRGNRSARNILTDTDMLWRV